MDPYYYSSPSYYYQQPSCPLHDSYSTYSSHYYQSPSSSSVVYNNSPINIYTQSSTPVQPTTVLNTTFELGMRDLIFNIFFFICFILAPPTGRRRRQRTIFTKEQVDILDQIFEKNRYPDIQLREQLSQKLDVPEARIQVCFRLNPFS